MINWLIKSRILTHIWEQICSQSTSSNKGRTLKETSKTKQAARNESERWNHHHEELVSLPRQFLVPLPRSLRAVSADATTTHPAACAAPALQLLSALAQRHFSLPWAATAFCCPSCCDFSWGLIYLHKLARDKVAQKWEWGQRRVTFNTPPSMTSHLTVGMLFHLFLPTTAFFKVLVRDICCKRLQTLWTLCQTPANLNKIVHHSWMFILWWKCNSTHIQSGTLCPSADGGFQPLFQRVTFNAAGWPSSHGLMLCGTAHPSDVLQLFS